MEFLKFKKIWRKISFFLWGTIVITLLMVSLIFIPFTNSLFMDKLTSEAENIISATNPTLKSSIIVDDYSDFIDFTLNLLSKNRYAEYLVISKNNGFSIIIQPSKWKIETMEGEWIDNNEDGSSVITENKFGNGEVFKYSAKITFPGIEWGMIHVGLNLKEYYADKSKIFNFASLLGFGVGIFSLFVALIFGKKLAAPIKELNNAAHEVAQGNLLVKCGIKTGDELEQLSDTFNYMTREIYNSHSQLEAKVKVRTKDLIDLNKSLQTEIEFRKEAESFVKASLAEKTTLLQEIHHRVKNNLQIISSLLFLQMTKSTENHAIRVLQDSQSRVKSMALVHEKLYKSENLSEIGFDEYIKDLSRFIISSYKEKSIKVVYKLEKIFLSINSAVPCGLIFNELISNVMKYAFPDKFDQKNPELLISLSKKGNSEINLSVKDNGVGLPDDFNIQESNSLGLKLVTNLVSQLDGQIIHKNFNGTEIKITFNEFNNKDL